MSVQCRCLLSGLVRLLCTIAVLASYEGYARAADPDTPDFKAVEQQYVEWIRPLLRHYCWECHASADPQGELDLERFTTIQQIRSAPKVWLKAIEMLEIREMPPRDAEQLKPAELAELRKWLDAFVAAEAAATAGDPGPVVLRRLNNAEYTYTIQELTGQPLDPAREFPADSAAGEGFTNTGNSLVMSPALLSKYVDAAKSVAEHAILLPDGIRFSPHTTPRDRTDDVLRRLREFYGHFTTNTGSTRVHLQGLEWETNAGGRLPLADYLDALTDAREQLVAGQVTPAEVAEQHHLHAKYMEIAWRALQGENSSALLKRIAERFQTMDKKELPGLVKEIAAWQQALTRFQSVGHMKAWLAPVEPWVERQELRVQLQPNSDAENILVVLAAGDAGDGNVDDRIVWQQPRLSVPGRADIMVADAGVVAQAFRTEREKLLAATSACLAAAAEFMSRDDQGDLATLAKRHAVDSQLLEIWFEYLSIAPSGPVALPELYSNQLRKAGGYDFVNGWGSEQTPNMMASSGDTHVRIPGNMKPHGVVVHPAPTLNAVVSWRSPFSGDVRIDGAVTHAHPECGNGVTWAIELRRGATRERLAAGISHGSNTVTVGPLDGVRIREGELLSILIGPRDGNHSCDLTDIEFKITEKKTGGEPKQWSLTADVSSDILAGNPHADRFGNADVWSFYSEPIAAGEQNRAIIPVGSLLKEWMSADESTAREELAKRTQEFLLGTRPTDEGPNQALWDQTHDANGPLLGPMLDRLVDAVQKGELAHLSAQAEDLSLPFGKGIEGSGPIDRASLASLAPAVVALDLPGELCSGRELVVTATLDPQGGSEGSVQVQATLLSDTAASVQPPSLTSSLPLVVRTDSKARERFTQAADDFRQVFPAALAYTKIVPVDEVVTLALFHREDDNLRRLMLSDQEAAELERLWEELHFVSRDLLTVEDAYEQLMQYATQDSDPKLFEHLREPIKQRADAFRAALLAAEPRHLASVADFAERAFRRPLAEKERTGLHTLYETLRSEGLSHEESVRLLLVRVLVSTSFLYRLEESQPGTGSSPVSDWEMASRLSYFLWSGPPDEALLDAAAAGALHEGDAIAEQARRMLGDHRTSRLSKQFASYWLQIQDVAELEEKSERHFPEFADIRDELQKEAELFFTDLFQNDRSILEIYDTDHTFLNEKLAQYYGIEGVTGDQWRRVDGVRKFQRGGVLTFGATLAKQSGASRTSPILRGTWISDVLLGEKLPKPPKDVPLLPTDEASETLSVRQLVERHTQDERCANCHVRIDPFGFALETFDAIGRARKTDLAGRVLDTATTLPDGTRVTGVAELRSYLVHQKRAALVRQFCRKLLGYALGRAVRLSDQQLLDEMGSQLAANDYRFSVAVDVIVRSQQFRHIRNADVPTDDE